MKMTSLYSFKVKLFFRLEVEKWKKNKKSSKLQEFYRAAFESFKSINDTFAKLRSFDLASKLLLLHFQLGFLVVTFC